MMYCQDTASVFMTALLHSQQQQPELVMTTAITISVRMQNCDVEPPEGQQDQEDQMAVTHSVLGPMASLQRSPSQVNCKHNCACLPIGWQPHRESLEGGERNAFNKPWLVAISLPCYLHGLTLLHPKPTWRLVLSIAENFVTPECPEGFRMS